MPYLYYVPVQSPADQPNTADELSEHVSFELGGWQTYTPTNGTTVTVSLDSALALPYGSRNFSLKIHRNWGEANDVDWFKFLFVSPQNLVGFNTFKFTMASRDNNALLPTGHMLKGTGRVILWSTTGARAIAPFAFPTGAMNLIEFSTHAFAATDFSVEPNFNWSSVSTFEIQLDKYQNQPTPTHAVGYDVWLDQGPFATALRNRQKLNIYCEDTNGNVITYGKNGVLFPPSGGDAIPQNLPFSSPLSEGTWTFTVYGDFVRWKDNASTNPTRVFQMVDGGSDQTYVAVFASKPPPPPFDWTPVVVVTAIAVVGLTSYYFLRGTINK